MEEKGLSPESADRIGEFVKHSGGRDLVERLLKDERLMSNARARAGLEDMRLLFDYLEVLGVSTQVRERGLGSGLMEAGRSSD